MDIKQINSAIIQGTFTDTELQSILDAVKFNRSRIRESVKRTLVRGAQVRFNSTRMGPMTGVVESVGIKNAVVKTNRGGWKVPMNMLEIV
jgi:hypothetical protein